MTQPGQTDGYTARQHWLVLTTYLGRAVDAVLLHHGPMPADILAAYRQQGASPVHNDLLPAEVPLVLADLVDRPDPLTLHSYLRPEGPGMDTGLHLIRHEPHRLAAQIMTLATDLVATRTRRQPQGEGLLFH
jgi:hypothetical protein